MRNNRFPIVVVVAGSTTAGQQLTEVELNECFKGCDETLRLERDKKLVLAFIESMMHKIAPNLCAMVGSSIAAQLIGLAGEARVTILSFFFRLFVVVLLVSLLQVDCRRSLRCPHAMCKSWGSRRTSAWACPTSLPPICRTSAYYSTVT